MPTCSGGHRPRSSSVSTERSSATVPSGSRPRRPIHAPVRPTVGYRIDDGETSVVLAGDTVPCAGLDELCTGADVLVHTVIRRDLIEPIGLPRA